MWFLHHPGAAGDMAWPTSSAPGGPHGRNSSGNRAAAAGWKPQSSLRPPLARRRADTSDDIRSLPKAETFSSNLANMIDLLGVLRAHGDRIVDPRIVDPRIVDPRMVDPKES